MKLLTCIQIGLDCGKKTLAECINIVLLDPNVPDNEALALVNEAKVFAGISWCPKCKLTFIGSICNCGHIAEARPLTTATKPIVNSKTAVSLKTGEFVIPFGQYKGTPLDKVPANYLDWLRDQDWIPQKFPEIALYLQQHAKLIDEELDDEDQYD